MQKYKELNGYYELDTDQETITQKKSFFHRNSITIIITLLLTALIFIVVIPSVAVTIGAGEKGVLYKRIFGKEGVQVDKVYPEGLFLVWPWNHMSIYDVRIQQVTSAMTVLAEQGMRIELDVSIRFYPKLSRIGYLHQRIGPNYVESLILPEVKGMILAIFAQNEMNEIYTGIYKLVENASDKVKKELELNYIIIDDVIVKSINFPRIVSDAINGKIREKQKALSYRYRLQTAKQEATRKKIEAQGIQSFQSIVSEGINENYLKWKGIDATLKLAESTNSKIVIIGSGKSGLPLILNTDTTQNIQRDHNTSVIIPKKNGKE